MRRHPILWLVATVPLSVALFLGVVSTSGAATQFDVINATGVATADHVSAGNDAFFNFTGGAVDNRYPLSFAHVDNLSAQAIATPLDTGPLGQTGAAAAGVDQPQYAVAKYPPKADTATVGAQGGPYGEATAKENDASARATAGGSPAIPTAAKTRARAISKLNAALLAWRATYLAAADAARYPFKAATASEPDGADGLTGVTHSVFDPQAGVLTVVSDSRISKASFGGGAIALRSIHMHVTITNSGNPQHDVATDIGSATVGGVPVTIGTDGVTVDGTAVPAIADAVDSASAQLNEALKSGGFALAAVRPVITTNGNQQSIDATALRVRFDGGDVGPGIPRSFVEHDLGEAYAFSLATPSIPVTAVSPNTITTGTPPTTKFIPGSPGTPGSPGQPATHTSPGMALGNAATQAKSTKPLWLLLLYFAWQSTLIGTAASLWWWRKDAA